MKYAIFDLDGTLIDSMWVWENIDSEFLKIHGEVAPEGIRERLRTLSVRQSSELLKSELNLSQSVEDIMAEIAMLGEDKYKNDVQLKPFVLETLNNFKKNNVKMCIATASVRKNVISVMTRLNLLDYFDFIITCDDIKTGKENPEIYNLCLEKFGANINDIVIFEDSYHAIKTAKKAGFKVIGVYDKSSENDILKIKEICYIYIENLGELEVLF